MRRIIILLVLACVARVGLAQDSLEARIILIGDAGKLNFGKQPVVDAARQMINKTNDKKTTVIFLGDNLYKTGLPENFLPGYEEAKAVLDSQINIVKGTQAKAIFIPGNHDWSDGSIHGLDNVKRQEAYINILGDKNILYMPSDGCPGPVKYKVNENLDNPTELYDLEKAVYEKNNLASKHPDIISKIKNIFLEVRYTY